MTKRHLSKTSFQEGESNSLSAVSPVDAAMDQVPGCRVSRAGNGHDTQGYVTASILQ